MMSLARFGLDPQLGGRLARRWLSGQIPGHRHHAKVLVHRWPLPLVVAITIVALYAPSIGGGHRDRLGCSAAMPARRGYATAVEFGCPPGSATSVRLPQSYAGFFQLQPFRWLKPNGEPGDRRTLRVLPGTRYSRPGALDCA